MSDGSTPTSDVRAPFAVGYGNGLSGEWAGTEARTTAADTIDLDATVSMAPVDLGRTRALTPVPSATSYPPFDAHPVGAAHPRRRLGRGLVLGGLTLLVAGAGVGAFSVASGADVAPASAASSGRPAFVAAASAAVDSLGRSVDPSDGTTAGPGPSTTKVPVSIIVSPTISRVPDAELVPPTAPPTTAPPTTAPPTTQPPVTAPPTTAPPTTTPPTTTPPATEAPAFTSITAPTHADCPTPYSDASISFSWTASHTDKVTLAIDGPGIYRTYPGSSGSETVYFPCSGSHTYLFTAFGADGAVATQSFTVSPS